MRGAANVADLAGADQVIKGAQSFLLRMSQRRTMELVQVNMIGLQALERIFAGFEDMVTGAASVIRQVTDVSKHFRRQDNPFPPVVLFQKRSGDSLTLPFGVYICRIEEVDSSLHSLL